MKQIIKDDIYYLYSDDGIELMTITLTDEPGNQIIVKTENEVYAGPVSFINFSDITVK